MTLTRIYLFIYFVSGILFSTPLLSAGNAEVGKSKASTCVACHGENGISVQDEWPNLAGQKAAYLETALKAYRDGSRQSDLMSGVATGLSDSDIADLAAYFSHLK
ncbi:MAG: c-type cytochrome [Arenicella sp.]